MVGVLPIGSSAGRTGGAAHSSTPWSKALFGFTKHSHTGRCRLEQLRNQHCLASPTRPACLFHGHPGRGRPARRFERQAPHAAASSGALASDDGQQQRAEGPLSQYDKVIIGLAVPALGSILLDPIMSLVDTGKLLQAAIFLKLLYVFTSLYLKTCISPEMCIQAETMESSICK